MTTTNYTTYHLHTELSLIDSCTNYKLYIDKAKELGQNAIGFSEHGSVLNWVEKKMYCESQGLKYIHGFECYLTRTHENKERDNYHTILIARNYEGVKEINSLIEISARDDHKYYNDRISLDEYFALSDNIIKISACLASPLNKIEETDPIYEKLIMSYDYLEVQPHTNSKDQIEYNQKLARLSKKYDKPLIAGTDTHSINQYKSECRLVLLKAKKKAYGNEDEFDLTYKSYDELVEMFKSQGALSEEDYLQAIENTNIMAACVEEFKLDTSFKYPKLYENEEEIFYNRTISMYKEKLDAGIIKPNPRYMADIEEEFRVFKKIGMCSFMLFMSELMTWCWENGIPSGSCRGSVGGSTIAYLTNVTDVDPVVWNTVFSRFANEDRTEIGDVDVDFAPEDRPKVFEYIVNRFGVEYTSFIMTTDTCADKGTIEEISRAFHFDWIKENPESNEKESPYHIDNVKKIKSDYESNSEKAKKSYPEIFYYFDGIRGCVMAKGMHPAAIIISPIPLSENYGVYYNEGKRVISINMEEVHEVSLVKYDILGLKNIGVIKMCCNLSGIPYPRSHTVDWEDEEVWDDMQTSNVGIFQYESHFGGDGLRRFYPKSIAELAVLNAALRPSGESYREDLFARKINKNPSEIIDNMFKDTLGYNCYQEQTILFLKDICGLSGSEADNVRRAIGRKQTDRLQAALPQILEGYCSKSPQPREVAEKEAQVFIQILSDSAEYQFGKNHATGYSLIGYICAWLRYYYPVEFCTALLAYANSESDTVTATELTKSLKITINPIKFRYSKGGYMSDPANRAIYKGIESIKFCNSFAGEELYSLRNEKYDSFTNLLFKTNDMSVDNRQLDILIKLDFFSEFGNSKELLQIADMFRFFKHGAAKEISIEKVNGVMASIISRHSRATKKKYILCNVVDCIKEIEQYILSKEIEDFTVQEKASMHLEYMGYVDIRTGLESDTFKLLVLDVNKLKTKDKSKVWAYKIKTISVGRGKQSELTIYSRVFDKHPINKFDTIYVQKEWVEKKDYNVYTNLYVHSYRIV